ncbi:SDR family NAD(P)-dependent oxidoreductase [Kitasatospora sp. NPDC054939]
MYTTTTTTAAARLAGRVALVTGGSRGIGAAVALRLAEEGADVAVTYRDNGEQAAAVVGAITGKGRRAWAVRADSADPQEIRAAVAGTVEQLGRLDILVNNAGVGVLGPFEELALADLDRVLDVNVRGPLLTAQAAAAHLGEDGRIVTIGSCMAERAAFGGGVAYTASKAALLGLTKALARELGPRGVTVNLVTPGPIDTEMNPADGPGADHQRGFTALGSFGTGADVAATVAHLAGADGRYITGASIAVDGGFAV